MTLDSISTDLIVFFCVISAVFEGLLIYGFLRLKQLSVPPGSLIFAQIIAQFLYDFHWLTVLPSIHEGIKGFTCKIIGALVTYCFFIGWNYNLMLSFEVYLKSKKFYTGNYKRRCFFYHFLTHASSLLLFIGLIMSTQNGYSGLSTCSIESGSDLELILVVPAIFHFPLCAYFSISCVCRTRKFQIMKKGISYHLYVVNGFCICYLPSNIFHFFNWYFKTDGKHFPVGVVNVIFKQCVAIVGATSGLVVFLARISQKGLFSELIKSFCCSKPGISIDLNKSILEEEFSLIPYFNLFEIMSKNVKIK